MKKGYYGKYYERLKLPEISECCKKYEGEDRVRYLEQRNDEQKQEFKENQVSTEEMYAQYRQYAKEKDEREKQREKYDEGFNKFKADYLMRQKQENDTAQEETQSDSKQTTNINQQKL